MMVPSWIITITRLIDTTYCCIYRQWHSSRRRFSSPKRLRMTDWSRYLPTYAPIYLSVRWSRCSCSCSSVRSERLSRQARSRWMPCLLSLSICECSRFAEPHLPPALLRERTWRAVLSTKVSLCVCELTTMTFRAKLPSLRDAMMQSSSESRKELPTTLCNPFLFLFSFFDDSLYIFM